MSERSFSNQKFFFLSLSPRLSVSFQILLDIWTVEWSSQPYRICANHHFAAVVSFFPSFDQRTVRASEHSIWNGEWCAFAMWLAFILNRDATHVHNDYDDCSRTDFISRLRKFSVQPSNCHKGNVFNLFLFYIKIIKFGEIEGSFWALFFRRSKQVSRILWHFTNWMDKMLWPKTLNRFRFVKPTK